MDSTAPTPGSRGRPYRTELSPVSFLRRSAYVFPDKVAVVHGERRTTYREFDERVNRLASALAAAGVERGDRVAFLAPNIPAMLEAHYGVPAAGAVLVSVNTRLGREEVVHILRHSGARIVFVDHELAHLVDDCRCAHGSDRRHRGARRPVRGLPRRRLARALRAARARRGGDDLDQLHLRDDGAAEGRDVHLPRRLPERAGRGAPGEPPARVGAAVGGADVPLQRLVLHVGGDRDGGAPRLPAQGRSRGDVGAVPSARGSRTTTRRPPSTSASSPIPPHDVSSAGSRSRPAAPRPRPPCSRRWRS